MNKNVDSIKQILKSKSLKNGIWLYALQFFNTVIPLLTVPYITRILGAKGYGTFSIALNLVMYLQVIVEYGFALSATRKVALEDSNQNLNKLFTEVTLCRFILYGVSMIFIGCYLIFSNNTLEQSICLLILAGSLFGYCFQENWMFQGKQDMKFISITNMIARVITTISIFIFVNNANDIFVYCILYSLSPIISNAIGTVIAIRKYNLKFVKLKINDIKNSFISGSYVFFTQLSSKVFGAIGITFLGLFATEYEVGVYSAIYKIPYMLMLLWTPISQVIYPISSKNITNDFKKGEFLINRIQKVMLILFSCIAVCVGILAKPLCGVLFGKEYVTYYYIVYPLLGWLLLGINNNFVGIQTLVGAGYDKEYGKCFQIGVVITIIINYFAIKWWKILGAALAPMLSEGILLIMLWYRLKTIEKIYT